MYQWIRGIKEASARRQREGEGGGEKERRLE